MDILEEIKERLAIFKNLYDIIRVVDPLSKKTINLENDMEVVLEGSCFDFWKRGILCDNCISIRAFLNNDTFVKVEKNEEKTFLITASPINIDGKIYIVEILKDITVNSLLPVNRENNTSLKTLINEMSEKIIKDDLTGIYNRRYIDERLPVDINKSMIDGYPLSIIMADIDRFKKINDKYGHIIGDKVLKDFAQLVSRSVRKDTDWVGRYGGEEFLIVLNNTDAGTAYNVVEKIRKHIDETVFIYENLKIHITSSFGVYSLHDENLYVDELISKADKNLYKAKTGGRNKTFHEI